jgi:CBS domain containing-hemolysin-like protein
VGLDLILAIVLVAANAFFVATEFAVARLRPTQVADFVRERRPGAKSAKHAVDHIDAYLSTCQLGITLASLGLGAVGEPAFHDLLEPVFGDEARVLGFGLASIVAFSIITVAHVVLGELSPKSFAIARTGPAALVLAPPMRVFYLATKPIVDLFNVMGNLVLKPFGVPPAADSGHSPHSEDEIRALLRESRLGGLIQAEESRLSENALVFGDLRAREVMRPRLEVDLVTTAESPRRAAEVALGTGRTRLPLCEPEGGLDSAIGVLNVKDLLPLALGHEEVDLRGLARPLPRVHEATRVDEVLRELRRRRNHIALVVDEHGTVTGILTMEDILEELVGEIEDEFDARAEEHVREQADGRLVVDGAAPLREVLERIGVDLDAHHEATIGGHLVERLGRLPERGEVVELHGARFEVREVGVARVEELAVSAPGASPDWH